MGKQQLYGDSNVSIVLALFANDQVKLMFVEVCIAQSMFYVSNAILSTMYSNRKERRWTPLRTLFFLHWRWGWLFSESLCIALATSIEITLCTTAETRPLPFAVRFPQEQSKVPCVPFIYVTFTASPVHRVCLWYYQPDIIV